VLLLLLLPSGPCCLPQEQKPIIWASQYNKVMAEKKAAKKQKPQQ
jgi:hypothetical protein